MAAIVITVPQRQFIKKSFKFVLQRITEINLTNMPIIKAHIKSLIPPPNKIVKADVEIPAKNNVLIKE